MEFNEYIRWAAEDVEVYDWAEEKLMHDYEQTGKWVWVQAAMRMHLMAEDKRAQTRRIWGWYLV